MTISPYSSWVCIYKLHHGHWMCSLFPGIITSTGAIFIGQSKKIHLKKPPKTNIWNFNPVSQGSSLYSEDPGYQ